MPQLPILLQALQALFQFGAPTELLPDKDCANCVYHTESWRDGGHCYMFRNEPMGTKCVSFKKKEKT